MKNLSKNEWIAIIVALLVVGFMFYGIQYVYGLLGANSQNNMDSKNELKTEVVVEGQGDTAEVGDTVTVNYLGTFEDGTKFDSSYDRGVPFDVTLGEGRVIAGWEQGLLGMKVGEKRKLVIPPALAYGENGVGSIPPNSTLIFEVEVLKIKKASK